MTMKQIVSRRHRHLAPQMGIQRSFVLADNQADATDLGLREEVCQEGGAS